MRALELREGWYNNPGRLDLAVIEAEMLWPDKKDIRERYIQTITVEIAKGIQPTLQFDEGPATEDIAFWTKLVTSAKRPEDFQKDAHVRFERGTMAGKVLFDAVGHSLAGVDSVRLGDITKRMVGLLNEDLTKKSTSSFENRIWPIFRPVSHLWAAWLYSANETDWAFPCEASKLKLFLSIAEFFSKKGEGLKTSPKAPSPILRQSESLKLPSQYLDDVSITFSLRTPS